MTQKKNLHLKFFDHRPSFKFLFLSFVIIWASIITPLIKVQAQGTADSVTAKDSAEPTASVEKKVTLATAIFDKFKFRLNSDEKDALALVSQEYMTWKISLDAFKSLLSCQYQKFDATAGDTACQVRTDQLLKYILHNEKLRTDLPAIIAELENSLDKVYELRKKILSASYQVKIATDKLELYSKLGKKQLKGSPTSPFSEVVPDSDESFNYALLKSYGITPPQLTPEMEDIVLNYFVTKYHSEMAHILPLKQKLYQKSFPFMSKSQLGDLLSLARKRVSDSTFRHMDTHPKEISEELLGASALACQLSSEHQKDLVDMRELLQDFGTCNAFKSRAAYATFKYLLLDLWRWEVPVLLKGHIFCPTHGLHTFDQMYVKGESPYEFKLYTGDPFALGATRPIAVFEGLTDPTGKRNSDDLYSINDQLISIVKEHGGPAPTVDCPYYTATLDKIAKVGLYNLSMSNGAKHPPFVDKAKEINFDFVSDPERRALQQQVFKEFYDLAEREGLCLDSMETMRLTHIYPSTLSNSYGVTKVAADERVIEMVKSETAGTEAIIEAEKKYVEELQARKQLELNPPKKTPWKPRAKVTTDGAEVAAVAAASSDKTDSREDASDVKEKPSTSDKDKDKDKDKEKPEEEKEE